MNVYDVTYVSGGGDEIDADFFEREADDWVFFAGGSEVFRIPVEEVVGVTKSSSRVSPVQDPTEHLFI